MRRPNSPRSLPKSVVVAMRSVTSIMSGRMSRSSAWAILGQQRLAGRHHLVPVALDAAAVKGRHEQPPLLLVLRLVDVE